MSSGNQDAMREALKRAASLLKQTEVPFALCGSYALWARGAPESEHDVDFMIAERDAEHVVDACVDAGMPVRRPAEDWLFKVEVDDVTVDIRHRTAGEPVTPELLERSDVLEVLSVRMPVLAVTDLISTRLRTLTEHYCDFGALLLAVRAVREQIDWARLRAEVAENDFAVAFLFLTDRLGISQG
jgi:hypothetical protein